MRTYDFSPLYRSTIGFDRLFDMLDQTRGESAPNWPPYNIERISDDDYRITMALAGFAPDEIELVHKENTLFVAGHKNTDQEQGAEVLHRGIATRPFRQSFDLAEHVKVVGFLRERPATGESTPSAITDDHDVVVKVESDPKAENLNDHTETAA